MLTLSAKAIRMLCFELLDSNKNSSMLHKIMLQFSVTVGQLHPAEVFRSFFQYWRRRDTAAVDFYVVLSWNHWHNSCCSLVIMCLAATSLKIWYDLFQRYFSLEIYKFYKWDYSVVCVENSFVYYLSVKYIMETPFFIHDKLNSMYLALISKDFGFSCQKG